MTTNANTARSTQAPTHAAIDAGVRAGRIARAKALRELVTAAIGAVKSRAEAASAGARPVKLAGVQR